MLTETADRNASKIPSYPDYFRCPAEGRGPPIIEQCGGSLDISEN